MLEFIKKKITLSFLDSWKQRTDVASDKPAYIHRSYQGTDVYVDLYWFIKKDKDTKHCESIYRRTDWNHVKDTVEHVENKTLLRTIKECKAL